MTRLCAPSAEQAKIVKDEFVGALIGDWRKVLDFCAANQILPEDRLDALREALQQVTGSSTAVRSEMVFYYFSALEAIRRKDNDAAAFAVSLLGNVFLQDLASGVVRTAVPVHTTGAGIPVPAARGNTVVPIKADWVDPAAFEPHAAALLDAIASSWIARPARGIALRADTEPVAFEIAKYEERTRALAGTSCGLEVISLDAAGQEITRKYERAFELIESVDPETAGEIRSVTEYVVPLRGRDFVGGSDIYLYGATFLRLESSWSELCYADHVIHEAAHQLMHAAHEIHPLLLNRDMIGAPSPIRSDPRPLYGSFHATFVFLRLARFMAAVLESREESLVAEAEIRLHRHLLGLGEGLEILLAHGEFSQEGRETVAAWEDECRRMVQQFGTPDPRLYTQLTWDYEAPPATTKQ